MSKNVNSDLMQTLSQLLRSSIFCSLIMVGTISVMAQTAYLDQAITEYRDQEAKWKRSITSTQDPQVVKSLLANKPNPRPVSRTIFKELSATLNSPLSMRGIAWIYKNDPNFLSDKDSENKGEVIRKSLIRYHYKNAGAGNLCMTITENFSPSDMSFLEKVATKSPSKEEQGIASLAISSALSRLGDEPELLGKRLKHLKKAIHSIPTGTKISGVLASDLISDQIYVIQNLTKGRVAPHFSGQDVAGKPLSYIGNPGKVTSLVFLTDQTLSPKTLSLLKSMKTLSDEVGAQMIGIYKGDPTKLRTLLANQDISWPTLYDPSGTVFHQYRINTAPVVYVIDQAGKIQTIGEPNALINLTIRALASSTE